MTKLVQVAQREFEALGQRGVFSFPNIILIECDWARWRAVCVDIFGLVALNDAASHAPNVLHGKRVVLRHEDLAVLPQGVWLSSELCIESYTSFYHVEHLFKVYLGNH